MEWKYRLVRKKFDKETLYGLVEDYDGHGHTDSLIGWYENVDEIKTTLQTMLSDIESDNTVKFVD